MKKTILLPVLMFGLCGTMVFAQNLPVAQELSASIVKIGLSPNKNIKYAQKEIHGKHLIDKETVTEQRASLATKNTGMPSLITVKVFPNPFANEISININENASSEAFYEAVLFDLQGRKVFSQELAAKKDKLNLSGIVSGMYILHVMKNGKSILQEKLIKE